MTNSSLASALAAASKSVTTKEPTLATKLGKSVAELRKQLLLSNDDEWREWLRGPGFKPFWTALYDDFIRKKKGGRAVRGVGLDQVLQVMDAFKEDFNNPYADTSDLSDSKKASAPRGNENHNSNEASATDDAMSQVGSENLDDEDALATEIIATVANQKHLQTHESVDLVDITKFGEEDAAECHGVDGFASPLFSLEEIAPLLADFVSRDIVDEILNGPRHLPFL